MVACAPNLIHTVLHCFTPHRQCRTVELTVRVSLDYDKSQRGEISSAGIGSTCYDRVQRRKILCKASCPRQFMCDRFPTRDPGKGITIIFAAFASTLASIRDLPTTIKTSQLLKNYLCIGGLRKLRSLYRDGIPIAQLVRDPHSR